MRLQYLVLEQMAIGGNQRLQESALHSPIILLLQKNKTTFSALEFCYHVIEPAHKIYQRIMQSS